MSKFNLFEALNKCSSKEVTRTRLHNIMVVENRLMASDGVRLGIFLAKENNSYIQENKEYIYDKRSFLLTEVSRKSDDDMVNSLKGIYNNATKDKKLVHEDFNLPKIKVNDKKRIFAMFIDLDTNEISFNSICYIPKGKRIKAFNYALISEILGGQEVKIEINNDFLILTRNDFQYIQLCRRVWSVR